MSSNQKAQGEAERAARLFTQQGSWHKNQWTTVPPDGVEGNYDQVLAFTIPCHNYPSYAQYVYQYNQNTNGREAFEFQLLMGFLHTFERMHKDLVMSQMFGDGNGKRGESSGATISRTVYDLHVQTGQPVPPGTRVVDEHGHILQHLCVPDSPQDEQSIEVFMEEVPFDGAEDNSNGNFPEFHWLKDARTPACYTIWVLLKGIDFNKYWMSMLRSNFTGSAFGAMSSVRAKSGEGVPLSDVAGAEREVRNDRDDAGSVRSDDEAEEVNGAGTVITLGKRRGGGVTTNHYKEPKKRIKRPGTHEFEAFKSILQNKLVLIADTYTGLETAMHYHFGNNALLNIGYAKKDPCNSTMLFSTDTALLKRPFNVSLDRSMVYYNAAHKNPRHVRPPYSSVTATVFDGHDHPRFVWRTPTGRSGSFWRLTDMSFLYPARFALKLLPYAQDFSSVLKRVYPGMFSMQSTLARGCGGGAMDTIERRTNMGPPVDVPVIDGVEMTQSRLIQLHEMILLYEDPTEAKVQLALEKRRLDELNHTGTLMGSRVCTLDGNSQHMLANSLVASSSNMSFLAQENDSNSNSNSCSSTNLTIDDGEIDELMDASPTQGSVENAERQLGFALPSQFASAWNEPVRRPSAPLVDSGAVRGVLVQFDGRTAEMDKLCDSIANLQLVCNPDVRLEIERTTRKLREQQTRQRAWVTAYRELTIQKYTTGWNRQDQNDPAAQRMLQSVESNKKQYDPAVLLNQDVCADIFELQEQRLGMDSRAMLIKRLGTQNTAVVDRLVELVTTQKALSANGRLKCIMPVEERALYFIHQQSVLRQYDALVAHPESDIPHALANMYKIATDKDLFKPNRLTFRRIVPNMSVLGNMLCMQMEEIEVIYCCSKPYLVLRGFYSSMSATYYRNRLKIHEMWFGTAAVTKSYAAKLVGRLRLNAGDQDKSCTTTEEIARSTDRVSNVDNGAVGNFTLRVYNETDVSMLMDPNQQGGGSSQWKIILDDGHSSTPAAWLNPVTKQLEAHTRESEQINSYLMLSNSAAHMYNVPIKDRFNIEEIMGYIGQSCSILRAMRREMNQRSSDELKASQLEMRYQTAHLLNAITDVLIKLKAIPDVDTWMVGWAISFVNARLSSKGIKEIAPRKFMRIEGLARIFVIHEAIMREFFTHGGMFFNRRIESWMLVALSPYLYVDTRHVTAALGLLVRNCFVQGAEDVRKLLNSMIECSIKGGNNNVNLVFMRDYRLQPAQSDSDQPAAAASRSSSSYHSTNTSGFRPDHSTYGAAFYDAYGGLDESSNQSAPAASPARRPVPARDSYTANQGGSNVPYCPPAEKFWHNFDFITFKRDITNDKNENKFKQLAQMLLNQKTLLGDDIRAEYTVDNLTSILSDLSEISRKCPHYVKHNRKDTTSFPYPSPDGQQIAAKIVSEAGNFYRISWDWLQQEDADPVENVKQALVDLHNFRHQPYERHTWTPSIMFPNTMDTIELGNMNEDSEDLEVMVNENPSYLPPEELFVLYYEGEMKDHEWKMTKGTRVDMSYGQYAAHLRSRQIMAHAEKTTEYDLVRSLYTAQRLLNKQDPDSRYYNYEPADGTFDLYDRTVDLDMPDQCYMIPCKMHIAVEHGWRQGGPRDDAGNPLVHHADLLYSKKFPDDPLARRAAYKKDGKYTLPTVINNRIGRAEQTADVLYESYPDVFRKRFENDMTGAQDGDIVNMSDTLTCTTQGLNEFSRTQLQLIDEQSKLPCNINEEFVTDNASLRRRRNARLASSRALLG